MKKKFLISLSFATIFIAWCYNNQATKIDSEKWISENWISVEDSFNNQLEDSRYINDFEDFLSYNILSITENKPYNSTISFDAKFDENSSVQWWVEYYQEKISKSKDLEAFDIKFNIEAEKKENDIEPFDLSWDISLLHQDNEIYANLHNLWIFMWEWNVTSKMYSLLWDLIIDKWINLEVHSWDIITIDEKENQRLPYIIWTIKNVLKTENIESSPDFLWSTSELIDTINSYIDLWISTDELKITDYEISYFELWDKTIQKVFTWLFQWKDSIFNLSFTASEKWLELHLYNIKEYDEDISGYKEKEQDFSFSIQENKKSEYSISFESTKHQQKVIDLKGEINYDDNVKINANFIFEPLEIIDWQKISWKLDWNITKKLWEWNKKIPELSWDILSLTELLSSL